MIRMIRSKISAVRNRVLAAAHQRTAELGNSGPVISFTFDDFPRTALTSGGAILEAQGLRATYYTAMSMMSTVNHLGDQFVPKDLNTLLHAGHELASHTFHHLSARKVSAAKYREDTNEGQRAIQQLTGQSGPTSFAYPYGQVTLATKKAMGADVSSARGIRPGINGPVIDLNLLLANSLYGDLSHQAAARELILENERRRGWLIFYTHDVQAAPSPYGCTPELLDAVVKFAAQRQARILTVGEVVSELAAGRRDVVRDMATAGRN
jgi:peptidoglycan/xylan/chitin deacetylase (PgdA/CDA1 family)